MCAKYGPVEWKCTLHYSFIVLLLTGDQRYEFPPPLYYITIQPHIPLCHCEDPREEVLNAIL